MASGSTPRLLTRRTGAGWLAALAALAGAGGLAATDPGPPSIEPARPPAIGELPDAPGTIPLPGRARRPAAPPTLLTPTPDGTALLWAERGTGRVLRAPLLADGVGRPTVLAELPVAPGASAGVRGIAVDRRGRILVAYVRRAGRRLVVVVLGGRPRPVWRGPRAGRIRVGGGLASLPGGRVVLAIGDQGRPLAARREGSLLGRVVSLAPGGGPGQRAHRRSRGWHDPQALAVDGRARIWVADRAGAGDVERTGRADRPRQGSVRSPFGRAPIGLALSADGRLLLACGLRSGRIDRTVRRGVVAGGVPEVLEARCRYGIAVAGDRVLVSDDDGLIRVAGSVAELAAAEPLDD